MHFLRFIIELQWSDSIDLMFDTKANWHSVAPVSLPVNVMRLMLASKDSRMWLVGIQTGLFIGIGPFYFGLMFLNIIF